MTFQASHNSIQWKLHFASSPEKVYEALTTDQGRATYWAESTTEDEGYITFHILNYPPYKAKILTQESPRLFSLDYFGTTVTFTLDKDDQQGTILNLHAKVNDAALRTEMTAGWVSVLMAMKAAIDFGVDLRNHSANMAWEQGFVDN